MEQSLSIVLDDVEKITWVSKKKTVGMRNSV